MKAPDWYPAWRQEAGHALVDLNEALNARLGLTTWERVDYDLSIGELTFSHRGKVRVTADVQLIGSAAVSWIWARDNGLWPARVVEDALKVRDFGEEHGIEELTRLRLPSTDLDQLGWSLAAVAARITGAKGVYRLVEGQGSLFLAYRDIRAVN